MTPLFIWSVFTHAFYKLHTMATAQSTPTLSGITKRYVAWTVSKLHLLKA